LQSSAPERVEERRKRRIRRKVLQAWRATEEEHLSLARPKKRRKRRKAEAGE
jgi:hypothetical protein